MSSFARHLLGATLAASLVAGSAAAQLLPSVQLPRVNLPTGQVPVAGDVLQSILRQPDAQQAISPTLDSVSGLSDRLIDSGTASLLDLRRLRLQQLIGENRRELEAVEGGVPVRRGTLIAIDPDPASLQAAVRAGFRITGDAADPDLNLRLVHLAVPRGMSARDALKRLRKAAPRIDADYDHIYEPAGGALLPAATVVAVQTGRRGGPLIGMIDGGVASHPALGGASIEQQGFAGRPQATGHGTAVASLIVGNQGPFRGAARNASLLVADVYGGNRAAGSATAVTRALGWLAGKRPDVINVSLVGPANRVVARAVAAIQARGIKVVAAVGNDGPAAPPQFPASYAGVVAVTGVDGKGRALMEAGKAAHLDFAAPGADMAAALPGKGYSRVRGTSFAAPLVAARLAATGSAQRLAVEAQPGKGRVGRGIICGACRIEPKAVGAK